MMNNFRILALSAQGWHNDIAPLMRAYQKKTIEKTIPATIQDKTVLDNIDKTMCVTNYTKYGEWIGDVARNCQRDSRLKHYTIYDIVAWLDMHIKRHVPTKWTR